MISTILSLPHIHMNFIKLLAASFFLIFATSTIADPPAQLTEEQKAQVDAAGDLAEKLCLSGAIMGGAGQLQSNATMKMMSSAASDPGFCNCFKSGLRDSLPKQILATSAEEKKQIADEMGTAVTRKCLAPVVVKKLSESCESIFLDAANAKPVSPSLQIDMDSVGASNQDEYAGKICGCIRPALTKITPEEFLDSTMAVSKAYRERALTGNKAGTEEPNAAADMFKTCQAQLQAQYKASQTQTNQAPAK